MEHWLQLFQLVHEYIFEVFGSQSNAAAYNISCVYNCYTYRDSKVHGANMGPTWVLSAPDGPHVGPMNLAIRV